MTGVRHETEFFFERRLRIHAWYGQADWTGILAGRMGWVLLSANGVEGGVFWSLLI